MSIVSVWVALPVALVVACTGDDGGTGASVGSMTSSANTSSGSTTSAGSGTTSGTQSTTQGATEGPSTGPATTQASETDATTTAATTTTTGSETDTTGPDDPPPVELEGYGTTSTFGEGGELCVVTTLEDSGPGSLRDCVEGRDTQDDNPTPRRIEFEVGGTIIQSEDLRIRQPYLTIDGLSAPEPGITLAKQGDGTDGETLINTWPNNNTCGHDVLIQGIRFRGVWTGDSEDHDQNAATIAIDGEDLPLCLHHVVLNRVTVFAAQDAGGDIWGSTRDVTVQYSAFLESLHPNTYSHFPGGDMNQERERLSNHHNLYARIHERGPQVRGNVLDANFDQNISHRWAGFGFGGGYGMRFRCRNGACPQRVNMVENHWTDGGASPMAGLILGDSPGANEDEPIAAQMFMDGNRLPAENVDAGTAPAEFPRLPEAEVTLYPDEELVSKVLPNIGAPYRTAEEDAIFMEVEDQVGTDLGG